MEKNLDIVDQVNFFCIFLGDLVLKGIVPTELHFNGLTKNKV